jgi:hypothetical protein
VDWELLPNFTFVKLNKSFFEKVLAPMDFWHPVCITDINDDIKSTEADETN